MSIRHTARQFNGEQGLGEKILSFWMNQQGIAKQSKAKERMAKKQQCTSGEVSCNGRDSSALSFRQHSDNDTLSKVIKSESFDDFSVSALHYR